MFFRSREGRRWRASVIITIGALAALGAVSIADKSKMWVKDKWQKACCIVKRPEK